MWTSHITARVLRLAISSKSSAYAALGTGSVTSSLSSRQYSASCSGARSLAEYAIHEFRPWPPGCLCDPPGGGTPPRRRDKPPRGAVVGEREVAGAP